MSPRVENSVTTRKFRYPSTHISYESDLIIDRQSFLFDKTNTILPCLFSSSDQEPEELLHCHETHQVTQVG
jgi:hypothetical protein